MDFLNKPWLAFPEFFEEDGSLRLQSRADVDNRFSLSDIDKFGPCGLCKSPLPTHATVKPVDKKTDYRWRREPFHYHVNKELIVCNNCYQSRNSQYNQVKKKGLLDHIPRSKVNRRRPEEAKSTYKFFFVLSLSLSLSDSLSPQRMINYSFSSSRYLFS